MVCMSLPQRTLLPEGRGGRRRPYRRDGCPREGNSMSPDIEAFRRSELERHIEELIALLDLLDDDADIEDGRDDEPTLGAENDHEGLSQAAWAQSSQLDASRSKTSAATISLTSRTTTNSTRTATSRITADRKTSGVLMTRTHTMTEPAR